ncbi:hypothetical protein [Candidatus Mycolicibacterium alkanivorans]|uniref:Uncharacterized protein n=1 Tax=Candidatus Mycolicibacterium alkanivorans TaxID=2954114 RepID=A0ABS9YXD1_9MYCO|nr:hypothetical protein [Candidatus Mycolicibacterium alkanivorans]MCI4675896.1 hypothetical protein [Candidatus Mycolicibacterium alkanivorans]
MVALAWILIPTGALLICSAVRTPIYYPRYLCFTAPAMAVLLGVCVVQAARKPWLITGVLVAFAVAALPNYALSQRGPYKREGMDYSQVADVVSHHAKPGDCLLLDNTTSWKPGPIRPLLAARPSAYRTLIDPGRGAPATSSDQLWDGYVPIWTVLDQVRRCTVLWTVSQRDDTLPDRDRGIALAPGPGSDRCRCIASPTDSVFGSSSGGSSTSPRLSSRLASDDGDPRWSAANGLAATLAWLAGRLGNPGVPHVPLPGASSAS